MSGLAAAWSADRMAAGNTAATWLRAIAAELVDCLDQAHAAGLFVPPRAAEAVAATQALARSWDANAHGLPATPGDKATLGVG